MFKLNFNKLFFNEKFVIPLSIVLAIIGWFIVSVSISPYMNKLIKDVPVTFNIASSATGQLGLDVVTDEPFLADVTIYGKRYDVGSQTAENIVITAMTTKVTEPGVKEILLQASVKNKTTSNYEFVSISPKSISVRFDRTATKKFTIETTAVDIKTSAGLLIDKGTANPLEVVITGPEGDVAKISRCVAEVTEKETTTESKTYDAPILLYDVQGKKLTGKNMKLSQTVAEVTVTVLKEKELPIKYNVINVPKTFPLESLKLILSENKIKVAGPVSAIDKVNEINIGAIDLSKLTLDAKIELNIELPAGFISTNNITKVTVELDKAGIAEKTLRIKNFSVINVPVGLKAKVNAYSMDVKIIGDQTVLNTLTAANVIGEIDLSNKEITKGQVKVSIMFYAPGKGLVWAIGEYSTTLTIS